MPRYKGEKMVRLVSELRKSTAMLDELKNLALDDLVADPHKVGSAKYHFIVAIESCIDMCNHVISQNGFRVPEDYADTFRVMAEAGVLETEFSAQLVKMAKFRNRLVHLYWEVDTRQLHRFLQERLDDFRFFLNAMASFLDWRNSPSGQNE